MAYTRTTLPCGAKRPVPGKLTVPPALASTPPLATTVEGPAMEDVPAAVHVVVVLPLGATCTAAGVETTVVVR